VHAMNVAGQSYQGSFTVPSLKPATVYLAQVKSKNAYGYSDYGAVFKFATKGAGKCFGTQSTDDIFRWRAFSTREGARGGPSSSLHRPNAGSTFVSEGVPFIWCNPQQKAALPPPTVRPREPYSIVRRYLPSEQASTHPPSVQFSLSRRLCLPESRSSFWRAVNWRWRLRTERERELDCSRRRMAGWE